MTGTTITRSVHATDATASPALLGLGTRTVALWAGAVLATFIGILQIVPVAEYLQLAPHLGVLFLIGGLVPLAAAAVMVLPAFPDALRQPAVTLMALASILMIVPGVVSQVVGLPGVETGRVGRPHHHGPIPRGLLPRPDPGAAAPPLTESP